VGRDYIKVNALKEFARQRYNTRILAYYVSAAAVTVLASSCARSVGPTFFYLFGGLLPMLLLGWLVAIHTKYFWVEKERESESGRRNGAPVLGSPPDRLAVQEAIKDAQARGKVMLDKYLIGFEVDSGKPIWITDDEICTHAAVFAKTGVGKTLWLESIMFQQLARGRASGFTFIDAKRDPGTLADIIMMCLLTGRIEDLIVVDPFDPVCAYNFAFTTQRADVKARKILRCGLPPTSDQSTTKHYDRLAADAVYRVVRAMESFGLAWSVRDIAVAMSAFQVAYPRLRHLLHQTGSKQAMIELGHLASSYRSPKGGLDAARLTDNLRGIASELHSISNSEAGEMFCLPKADLCLTDAILRGKIVYYMLPRLEEAESAARMVKVFREDLEVSIGEITSSRTHKLEDPHLVVIDEGASTFGPTWANLFELARKGRFALLFGAQSVGGLMDQTMGLSEEFYERVMANVNLKVIMRLGDNRTATDMSEWIGLVKSSKKSVSTALSQSVAARELTKNIEINRQSNDGFRDGITLADDEEELVSPDELKHEMSAEKGLAIFEKGDGIIRKGRSLWFDADVPGTWEGREYLTRYESVEADEVGLAEWVDEQILTMEEAEHERGNKTPDPTISGQMMAAAGMGTTAVSAGGPVPKSAAPAEIPIEDDGAPFRLNIIRPLKGRIMGRGTVTTVNAPQRPELARPEKQDERKAEETPQTPEKKAPFSLGNPAVKQNSEIFSEQKSDAKHNDAESQPVKDDTARDSSKNKLVLGKRAPRAGTRRRVGRQ
jgi:hypothetical protein